MRQFSLLRALLLLSCIAGLCGLARAMSDGGEMVVGLVAGTFAAVLTLLLGFGFLFTVEAVLQGHMSRRARIILASATMLLAAVGLFAAAINR